jgi:hypothetical protein
MSSPWLSPEDANKMLFAIGLVTFILSFLIVICTIFNPSIRSKLFPRIVAWISFCEMMGSLSILFGVTKNDLLCTLQSGLFMFFERAGWNWTVVLALQLDGLVTRKNIPFNEWQMHAISWSISLFFEIVPFFRNMSYGSDDDSTICSGLHYHRFVTEMIAIIFTGYLFIVILILFFLNIKLFHFLRISGNERLISVARTLRRYPAALIVFWLPNMVISTFGNSGGPNGYEKYGLISYLVASLSLGILYGGAVAGLYMYTYSDMIKRWARSRFSSGDNLLESMNESHDYLNGKHSTSNNPNNTQGTRGSQSLRSSVPIDPSESSHADTYDYIDEVDIVDYDRSGLHPLYNNDGQYSDKGSGISHLTANSQDDSVHSSLLPKGNDPNSKYYIGKI